MTSSARTHLLGLDFDALDLDGVLAWIDVRAAEAHFAYVVTPNTDHVVRLEREPADGPVWQAYRDAALCLCDSRVIGRLARLRGISLSVVPGSDLTRRFLAEDVREGDRLCLVGGDAAMVRDLAAMLPDCEIVQHIPPMGFRHDAAAMAAAVDAVVAARARVTLLAVGSPQQELLAHAVTARGGATGIGLCIGASIEFVTGRKARAPRWMQTLGIEWLHRLLSDPMRLWRRYLVEGPRIFAMMLGKPRK